MRILWTLAVLMMLASLGEFVSFGDTPCLIAATFCAVACGLTYRDTWRLGR